MAPGRRNSTTHRVSGRTSHGRLCANAPVGYSNPVCISTDLPCALRSALASYRERKIAMPDLEVFEELAQQAGVPERPDAGDVLMENDCRTCSGEGKHVTMASSRAEIVADLWEQYSEALQFMTESDRCGVYIPSYGTLKLVKIENNRSSLLDPIIPIRTSIISFPELLRIHAQAELECDD